MIEFGTYDTLRAGIPAFDRLWEMRSRGQLMSSLSEEMRTLLDDDAMSFYLLLYRSQSRQEKGQYVGKSTGLEGREGQHRCGVFQELPMGVKITRYHQLARRITKDGGEMRFIPITFLRAADFGNFAVSWVEQLFVLLFESYNAQLFAQWSSADPTTDFKGRGWSKYFTEKVNIHAKATGHSVRTTAFITAANICRDEKAMSVTRTIKSQSDEF